MLQLGRKISSDSAFVFFYIFSCQVIIWMPSTTSRSSTQTLYRRPRRICSTGTYPKKFSSTSRGEKKNISSVCFFLYWCLLYPSSSSGGFWCPCPDLQHGRRIGQDSSRQCPFSPAAFSVGSSIPGK